MVVSDRSLRGHALKLQKPKLRTDMLKYGSPLVPFVFHKTFFSSLSQDHELRSSLSRDHKLRSSLSRDHELRSSLSRDHE